MRARPREDHKRPSSPGWQRPSSWTFFRTCFFGLHNLSARESKTPPQAGHLMSCQPTSSRSFGGIAYTQSAQGKSNQKVLGSVQREQGLLTLLLPGNHHSSDSCNVILVSFLTAQLKKYLGIFRRRSAALR